MKRADFRHDNNAFIKKDDNSFIKKDDNLDMMVATLGYTSLCFGAIVVVGPIAGPALVVGLVSGVALLGCLHLGGAYFDNKKKETEKSKPSNNPANPEHLTTQNKERFIIA